MNDKNRREREYFMKRYILNRKYLLFTLLAMIIGGIALGVANALLQDKMLWVKNWPIFQIVGVAIVLLASDFFYSRYSKKNKR